MSAAPLSQSLLAAGVVGGIAAVGVVAALLSSPSLARSHPAPLTRAETKPCSVTFCTWDDVAPTPPTDGATFNMPGSLVLWAFSDCTGCVQLARGSASPSGFAFGFNGRPFGGLGTAQEHASSDLPHGSSGSHAGDFAAGVNSAGNAPGGPSNGGSGDAPGLVGTSGAPPIQVAAATVASVTTTPEPATFGLLAAGMAALFPVIRRKRRDSKI